MSKIELDNITSGYNLGKINANFVKIENALTNNVLFRDATGSTAGPNQMVQDIDMDSQSILNLPTPTAPTNPVRLQDLGNYALATELTEVDNRLTAADVVLTNSVNALDGRVTTLEQGTSGTDLYIHWLYNNGLALGGEVQLNIPYEFTSIATVYINGVRMSYGLAFDFDVAAKTVQLAEALETGDEVVVSLGVEPQEVSALVQSITEEVTLTDGQTVVTFVEQNTNGAAYYINGPDVDSRFLSSEDFTASSTTNTTITLTESYPAGSIITLSKNVAGSGGIDGDIRREFVHNEPTLAVAVTSTLLRENDAINLRERTTGNGGGAMWDVVLSSSVTENGYNIVQCTGVPTLSLVLRIGEFILDTQWGVPRDGSDGSVQLQNFLNYWRDNQVDAQLDKGDININTPLLIEFTANSIPLKKLKGNASRILSNLTVAAPLLRIVSSAVVKNIDIDSITFRGEHGVSTETSLLELDGGDGSAGPLGQYMYNMVLSNNRFEDSNGHGLHILNNVFEVNIISCFARASQNTTGKGFFFEFGAAGNPSSIELIACVTAGWFNGVHVDSPVEDVKITGGTFILAQAHGVKLSNNNSSMVTNIHVENNWEGAADLNSGGAGIKAENSSILTGVYGTTNSKQKYVVDLYCTGKKNAIIGGSGSGSIVKYANINGAANTSLTFMNDSEFDIVNNNVTILRIADAKIKVGENLRDSTIELSKSSEDNSRLKIRRWTGVNEDYQNFEMITTGQQLDFNTGAAAVVGAEVVDQTMLSLGFGSVPKISFYGATPITQPDVTGSKGANAALTDLILKLTTLGMITDSTS